LAQHIHIFHGGNTMRNNGFTLIDLIITLSVMSILLTIGLPSVSTQIQNARVKAATNSLLEAINLTRSQAVFANKRATIRKQNEWEGGWEIFFFQEEDGIRDYIKPDSAWMHV
ncbi:MAG TPA: GspH/FimT family pseudopilin, partial [Candidatus Omnitrophota bacterium]|nr:GspH/FimT family pseudopilin [Candidatus Omnitrophota bacterium]